MTANADSGCGEIDPVVDPVVDPDSDPVAMLTRWEVFGGAWRVIARTGERVTISMCRCDSGEEQQRLTSSDPALSAWLGDRQSN